MIVARLVFKVAQTYATRYWGKTVASTLIQITCEWMEIDEGYCAIATWLLSDSVGVVLTDIMNSMVASIVHTDQRSRVGKYCHLKCDVLVVV